MKIAIDGTAASGKGTLARKIAQELGYDYLDTGLLYRAVTFDALSISSPDIISLKNTSSSNYNLSRKLKNTLTQIATNLTLPITDVPELRSQEISQLAGIIASIAEVRQALIEKQKDFAEFPPSGIGAILDGRDIGSVILPEANYKFFIDAKPEIRAKRRFAELKNPLPHQTESLTLAEITERDFRDKTRPTAPLKRLPDAFFIDTSLLNADEVLQIALNYINREVSL
ncbi:(d)CMP kinase [Alphaproteobacteria bacterium]|jgi:CMP/dCMP kinase|nr:(d)CMP kinase [Alphaproteobacteria bacterium]MBT5799439.1 (d)CMP kinase [Alphaproteobacteria bacterium]MDA9815933.1 (d)CMP kinase [Alphaproteobacteria bacterium]MDC0394319.1 (d)CMP kinase [Alphaproteobacteria bacterium]MDC0461609.1 (d)CMP kinase [Alphaproteobacteria bacterium]